MVVADSDRKIIRGQYIFIGRYDFKLVVDYHRLLQGYFNEATLV